jgi:hypothetical protein
LANQHSPQFAIVSLLLPIAMLLTRFANIASGKTDKRYNCGPDKKAKYKAFSDAHLLSLSIMARGEQAHVVLE